MRTLVPLLLAGLALVAAAPASAAGTEIYVFQGRVVTFDPQPAMLTLSVATTNKPAQRFRFRKVRFHVALADVEIMDRTGDNVGLAEDIQASDHIRISVRLNKRLAQREPFEALRIYDLTAPPR
jgi:hypothetical protein